MRQEKKGIVEELTNEIKGVNPLVLTDYAGIKANDLTQLHSRLIQVGAKYRVVKNRLFQRALDGVGLGGIPVQIKGPLAIAYGGRDVIDVIKRLVEFCKDYPDTVNIKGGIVDNTFLDSNKIEALAKLPPKEVLLARLVAQIGAPIGRLTMVLRGNLQRLVCVLDGIKKKKDSS